MQCKIDWLKIGYTHLQQDRTQYRQILRRDIAVRARDILSLKGHKPQDVSFYHSSHGLSAAFLQERNLTEGAIHFISGTTPPFVHSPWW